MTTTNTFGVVFFIKRQKEKNDHVPIYARITVDGKRAELSLKINIHVDKWNHGSGKAKSKSEDNKALNTYLEQIRSTFIGQSALLQMT